jgi:hypothetical protein
VSQLRPSLGFRDRQRGLPRASPPPRSWLPPRRASPRLLHRAISTATSRDQLGEIDVEAVGSSALQPGRSSPLEVTTTSPDDRRRSFLNSWSMGLMDWFDRPCR